MIVNLKSINNIKKDNIIKEINYLLNKINISDNNINEEEIMNWLS